jgi:SAM-dependent methyltransferase
MTFNQMEYWENRYQSGGNSGPGSYNERAELKANALNAFIKSNGIEYVIDFGCGDGNQLSMLNIPHYIGFDVSDYIINQNRIKFESDDDKEFYNINKYNQSLMNYYDLSMSLEVILHLVNDHDYTEYMDRLLSHGSKYLVIQTIKVDYTKRTYEHVMLRDTLKYVLDNSDYELIDDQNMFENSHMMFFELN